MGIGPAAYANDADIARRARTVLDRAAAAVEAMAASQRAALGALLDLWPTAAWLAAGCHSPFAWLIGHTSVSSNEARRLVRVARVCAAHPALAEAVCSGALPLGRADTLARVVTAERAPFLTDSLPALLRLGTSTHDDDHFASAVRYWLDRVDEHLAPRQGPHHRLYLTQRLFGGGRIDGELTPASFATVAAALDAYTQKSRPGRRPVPPDAGRAAGRRP